MKHARAFIFFGVLAAGFFAAGLSAIDWPTSNGKIAENFGKSRDEYPRLGITFNADGDVYSVAPGEILFHYEEISAGNFISPLGNWVACDQGDGYISIYAKIDNPIAGGLPERIDRGVTLGSAGRSGYASKDGFYFSFFDRQERRRINPRVLLNPLTDTIPPSITSVKLKDSEGRLYELSQIRSIKQGRYAIVLNSTDRSEITSDPVAPFRVVSMLNGTEVGRVELESFGARDGVLLIYRNGLMPAERVYGASAGMEVAGDVALSRGQISLDISVQDFSGNARNVSYRLYVE